LNSSKIELVSNVSHILKMSDAIVCDVGTDTLKLGYSSCRSPSHVVPSIVGKCLNRDCLEFGHDALKIRNEHKLSYPIEGGIVQNWDDFEALLAHSFGRLTNDNHEGSGSKLLITEPVMNPIKNKKKMMEVIIESMNFGTINITNQAILVLYSHGLLSGMVIDCGEGATQIAPIYEGFIHQHLVKRHPVVGSLLTKYLSSLLQIRSNSKFTCDMVTVKDIKEKMCYASQDLKQDRRLARETTALDEN